MTYAPLFLSPPFGFFCLAWRTSSRLIVLLRALPEQFLDVPYAPFGKSDRIGRAADFTAPIYFQNRSFRECVTSSSAAVAITGPNSVGNRRFLVLDRGSSLLRSSAMLLLRLLLFLLMVGLFCFCFCYFCFPPICCSSMRVHKKG